MKRTVNWLWLIVIVTTLLQLIRPIVNIPFSIELVVLLPTIFALVHGALRYGWRGILIFLVVCLVVSNIFENMSILTGFPFGNYEYSDVLGIKLFLVPVLIGPAYFSTGYLAWVLARVIVGDVRRKSSWFLTIAVPVIASFLMVAWDLCFDPSASTVGQSWIWKQGGGFFGVPLSNYLGWYLVVYIFLQIFALYLRFQRTEVTSNDRDLPRPYFVQAIILYAAIAVGFLVKYVATGQADALVTDAAGIVWHTASITETAAIISIFTMVFGVAIATIKLVQATNIETVEQAMSNEAAPVKAANHTPLLQPQMHASERHS
jgi:uncharacterized membrane protein